MKQGAFANMHVLYDPACAGYAAPGHPEAPFRVLRTEELLREKHPGWFRDQTIRPATDDDLLRAHAPELLTRLRTTVGGQFDADTAALLGMDGHARRGAGGALEAASLAVGGDRAFSLMRPPGHHATRAEIMGFCYLNAVAVAALHALDVLKLERVAVWDFDAHHGNGTENILHGRPGARYVSVHQYPGYPGTGTASFDNVCNHPVAPGTSAAVHLAALERSWADVLDFRPDLILVSAGFDAYAGDPLTDLRLRPKEFTALGGWMREAPCPVGAILEGGYSQELPVLIHAFLEAWEGV